MAKKQHLSYNHSKQHKVHHNPYPVYAILALLLVAVGVTGLYSYKTIKENNKPLTSEYVSSELAKSDFLNASAPEAVQKNANKAAPGSESTNKATSQQQTKTIKPKSSPVPAKNPETAITGNANTSVAPTLPPNVPQPISPTDSVRLFVSSVKNGDLKTANTLIGPTMAYGLASVAGTSDQSMALEACRVSSICSALLTSFEPPVGAKESIITGPTGEKIAQVSFKLSQSSPLLATLIGDQNIDIFFIDYQGTWVIQNVYINGKPFIEVGF